jgi:hypothetical protein
MKLKTFAIFLVLTAPAFADTVTLKDGTTREGVVINKTTQELQLRVDKDGMKATLIIPMADVASITDSPVPAVTPKTPATTTTAATQNDKPKPATTLPTEPLPPSKGFFGELLMTIVGNGPDNPDRLPRSLRDMWETAVRREVLGNKAETLEALQALDDAFASLKGGPERLDAICRRERKDEPFGLWLAKLHWEAVTSKYVSGQLDFKDVRESERKYLIGMLKEKTAPAIQPLQGYFPPNDPTTGRPTAFKQSQLAGITVGNAIEVKRTAMYASAILQAQLKLEPNMPAVDRVQISAQLQNVSRVLSHAGQLEPAARIAAEKAERERKIAEERARRGN